MTTNICLQCRVSEETKARFGQVAQLQQLTESAFLRRLVDQVLSAADPREVGLHAAQRDGIRSERLMIRLLPDDRQLLEERAEARGMRAGTYLSVLARSHLRRLAPLPTQELLALKRCSGELGAIGRLLNQIARVANQSGKASGPSREELRGLLQVCQSLRGQVTALMDKNLKSWDLGYEETDR
jgi:hypothetical protein